MTDRLLSRSLGLISLALGAVEIAAPDRMKAFLGGGDPSVIRVLGVREIATGVAVLTLRNPAPAFWVRIGGDVLDIALLSRLLSSARSNTGPVAASLGSVGLTTVLDLLAAVRYGREGASGEGRGAARPVERSLTVGRSPDDLYALWRAPETLPRLMDGQGSVSHEADGSQRWRLDVPKGKPVEWTTTVTADEPGARVAWGTAPKTKTTSQGEIRFRPGPGDWGTVVTLRLGVEPKGPLGETLVSAAERQVLHRFKSLAETGEVPTISGQPAARHDGRDR